MKEKTRLAKEREKTNKKLQGMLEGLSNEELEGLAIIVKSWLNPKGAGDLVDEYITLRKKVDNYSVVEESKRYDGYENDVNRIKEIRYLLNLK